MSARAKPLQYGLVTVTAGAHEGRVGYYDDDDTEKTAVVYFGGRFTQEGPHLVSVRYLRQATPDEARMWRTIERRKDICDEQGDDAMDQAIARFVAMVVRNEMEDFHASHLSDWQMSKLNPIIRNAIFTALVALRKANEGDEAATCWRDFQVAMIPGYWEQPKLCQDFNRAVPLTDIAEVKPFRSPEVKP